MRNFFGRLGVSVALVLLTTACGGGEIEGPLTLTTIETEIFARSCTSCHGGSSPSEDLDLEGRTYERLVNVPSAQAPNLMLVAPGDPDASYLYLKITGQAAVGNRMPPLRGLSDDRIAFIESWILDGAEDE
jgi:hypothetical protein